MSKRASAERLAVVPLEQRGRARRTKSVAVAVAAPAASPWLVGPAFDLVFLANCLWPLAVVATVFTAQALPEGGFFADPRMSFWIYYFLTTPHRWITLAMVFLDGDRFWRRPRAFVAVAVTFALLVSAVWLSTGTVVLLVLADYLWNAWHYASQHQGISRIYSRATRPDVQFWRMFEKIGLRVFILYALFRPLMYPMFGGDEASSWPGWVQRVNGTFESGMVGVVQTFQGIDLVLLAIPAVLLLHEARLFRREALGRVVYLVSLSVLYAAMILGVHLGIDSRIVLGLLLSTSVFHSTEYLAIVSWSVWKKHGRTPETLFGQLIPRWGFAMATFVAVLALTGWMMDRNYLRFWLLVTVLVSYLHYAYDGMIWKVRRPSSAAVA